MNEEIEYAEMLEIPVSTVNVVRKKRAKKNKDNALPPYPTEVKNSLITQINAQPEEKTAPQLEAEQDVFTESAQGEGALQFDGIPERIDTIRLYSQDDTPFFEKEFALPPQSDEEKEMENDVGRYALNGLFKNERTLKRVLNVEFAAVCALCGVIFMTNIFMPNSAINTFFHGLMNREETVKADHRAYSEFTLSPIVSELADVDLTLSETGVVTLLGACCVYPSADGTVRDVTQNPDGTYTLTIGYSTSFSGVMEGLSDVFYQVGDGVKANVPVGYTDGKAEVAVTMYDAGAPLDCLFLTEENCLVWLEE